MKKSLTRAWSAGFCGMLATTFMCRAAQSVETLWQIGQSDNSASEFALAPRDYRQFLHEFGKPENAYYIGLSNPKTNWSYVLPGPRDAWAGSSVVLGGLWDQMNTLPIGFILERVPGSGNCVLILDLVDTHHQFPPRLRITVNGSILERELTAGGSGHAIEGYLRTAQEQMVRVEFPSSLLRSGYNEIALRAVDGAWMLFDSLRLDVPIGARSAPTANTVIRSVSALSYALPTDRKTPAAFRVEVFRFGSPGKLQVQIDDSGTQELALEPGLQLLEIAAPASAPARTTRVRLSADGQLLNETQLYLPASARGTAADYVDVFKGTAHSRWMIAPGPWMPFGMVKLAPDNQAQGWIAGYDYRYEHIDTFSHIHEWTMAGLGMMPTTGALRTQPGLDGTGYSSRFDKSTERGSIGSYEVLLKDSGIKVELTATTRASLQRYTFPSSDQARVLFDFLLPNEYEMEVISAKVRRVSSAEIEGVIATRFAELGYNGDQYYNLHFVTQFDKPFESFGGWQERKVTTGVRTLSLAGDCGAFVDFKTHAGENVQVRTGISLVSIDNARLNLEEEIAKPFKWNFAAVVQHQRRLWNELLERVEIHTADAREKSRFYTNLYRAFAGRNTWSDVNGEWADPEERKQKLTDPTALMLGGDAFWNTFWNLNQVMNLLAPEWSARWVQAQLALYETSGWLSKGSPGLEYVSVMVAEHEIPLLVAAHQHGVKGIDASKALAAGVKTQTTLPQSHPGGGWVGNENLENYLKYGYVAVDGPVVGQDTKVEWRHALTSNTLEYAYDDWTVAQLALKLGRRELAEQFLKRSQSWRNVFDREAGFARPRKANGEWISPFDPFHTPGFVEGNAWQYTWFVPHDVPGLVTAMGRDRFVSRLSEALERSETTRFNAPGERLQETPINHGNQPSMHVAWLFNWAGQPWLTQKWSRSIMDAYYGHNPADAYLGDEDQGQMSAWFVMSALGLFQTDGGARVNPIYEIGSPLYPKIVLHLSKEHYGGRTFTIEAHNTSRENRYVQSATLNGQPLNRWWLWQKELVSGGTLALEMGSKPNKEWATSLSPN